MNHEWIMNNECRQKPTKKKRNLKYLSFPTTPFSASTSPFCYLIDWLKQKIIISCGGTGGHIFPGLEIAKSLQIEKFILVGNSGRSTKLIEDKIISDCCESLLGAIYIDQGINVVEKFILRMWSDHLNSSENTFIDSKTKLQEFSLKKYKILPVYKLIENTGPRHKPKFKVSVKIKNSKFVVGEGLSKKEAEQNAAKSFIEKLGI